MLGVLCQAWPPPTWQGAKGWQAVVTYELVKAFCDLGVDAQPVVWDATLPGRRYALPVMDHAIVVTELARKAIQADGEYRDALRANVDGKLCLYIDAPFGKWDGFDLAFTGENWGRNEDEGYRRAHSEFVWAGFGSDEVFHPARHHDGIRRIISQYPDITLLGHFEKEWEMAQRVMMRVAEEDWEHITLSYVAPWSAGGWVVARKTEDARSGQEGDLWTPVVGEGCTKEIWRKWEGVGRYEPYGVLPEIFAQADVYLDLRGGALDLTRIDAAYAGLSVVAHAKNWRDSMHGQIPAVEWKTEDDLYDVLQGPFDRWQIATDAREHTWTKVALRMIEALEE